jgi:tRNA pseudouridine(55) synthase
MSLPKVYRVEGRFGAETSTDDAAGTLLRELPLPTGDVSSLRGALTAFLGWRNQRPPSVSAVHVEGVRAHERARKGQEFDIAPRPIFVEALELLSPMDGAGRFGLRVRCRKGTYVRSLIRDLGRALGSGAHVGTLRRIRLGPFDETDAVGMDRILESPREELEKLFRPISDLTGTLPTYAEDSPSAGDRIRRGLTAPLSGFSRRSFGGLPGAPILLLSPRGISLCTLDDRGDLHPKVNLSPEWGEVKV